MTDTPRKTYAQLTAASDVQDADLLASYRSTGPLKKVTASTFANYIKAFFSASGGSALIGFLQAGTGAVARTAQAKMRETVSPEDFGGVGDGVADDSAAFQAMLTAAPKTVVLNNTYKINSVVTGSASIKIIGPGTVDCSGGGQIVITGSLTQIGDLGSNAAKGNKTLTFGSAPSLSPFDVAVIYNPTNSSWSSAATIYRAGEMVRVATVSGSTVNLYGRLFDAYTTAAVDVYRLDSVRVEIDGPTFIESTTGTLPPLKISLADGVRIGNPRTESSKYASVILDRCYDFVVYGADAMNNSPESGLDYGIVLSNCQNGQVIGGNAQATRHGLTFGGGDVLGCVTNREIDIIGVNLSSATGFGADFHANVERCRYVDCQIQDGVTLAGQDVAYVRCTIGKNTSSAATHGNCVFGSNIRGGYFLIEDCVLNTDGDGNAQGFIDISSSASQVATASIIIRNLLVPSTTGGGANAKLVKVAQTVASSQNVNVVLDGVVCNLPTLQAFLYCENTADTTYEADYLIVDNVFGPSGTYLLYPTSGGDVDVVPCRMMKQRGRALGTTTASAGAFASSQTFRYPYHRTPSPSPVAVTKGDWTGSSAVADQIPVGNINALSATAITPAAYSQSLYSFTAAVSMGFHWEVGIDLQS